ncbi:MAG: hypothetical protein AAFX76_08895 [Planctomycetota bacterium]
MRQLGERPVRGPVRTRTDTHRFKPWRSRWLSLVLAAAAVAWGWTAPPAESTPLISEVFLPTWGATGVEVFGVGETGATLLVLDATPGRGYTVRRAHTLGPGGSLFTGGVQLLAEPGWDTATPVAGLGLPFTPVAARGLPFDRATTLVLIDGPSPASAGVSLSLAVTTSVLSAETRVTDWLTLVPGDDAGAIEPLTHATTQAFGLDALPRPAVAVGDAVVVARALLLDGHDPSVVLTGNTRVVDGGPAGFIDFAVTPGLLNPVTRTPEPVGVAWVAGVIWGAFRRRATRGRSIGVY